MDFQIPIRPFSSAYEDLSDPANEFVNYFSSIRCEHLAPVIARYYAGIGPTGYGISLILSRILKVKEIMFSDRILADKLMKNATFRAVCLFEKGRTPSHNTYNTLRRRLGVAGFRQIHRRFVLEANALGLLNPDIPWLSKVRKKGIILVGDSTFIQATCATKGKQQEDGSWLFQDQSVSFGRQHHKYRYAVGHKAHSLMSVTGIPMISVVTSAAVQDQVVVNDLVKELVELYPELSFAYIILDRGYDTEDIHKTLYERYHIIPVIIRKKITYPKGFNKAGYPLCPFGYAMTRIAIDYKRKRTKFSCRKICQKKPKQQSDLFVCEQSKMNSLNGLVLYTYFRNSYRKFGPAVSGTTIYKQLKPMRTSIEREYGLVKENRYKMEHTNTYQGIDNVAIHVIEHDITLTQDIIFEFQKSKQRSPVLKFNY